MASQKLRNSLLPKWVVALIFAVFVGHYMIVGISLFSKQFLGERYYYLTYSYLSPWFYQNITAFAPEPPLDQKWFIYRVSRGGEWEDWKVPAFKYLRDQHSNRFSTSAKVHDQLEVVADYIYKTFDIKPADSLIQTSKGRDLPVVDAGMRVIKMEEGSFSAPDSFQLGVFIVRHSVVNGVLDKRDTAKLFPKFQWIREE